MPFRVEEWDTDTDPGMGITNFPYDPIYIGYFWEITLKLTATPALFPQGAALRAQFRRSVQDQAVATLTTENGDIAILDQDTVYLRVHGNETAKLKPGTAVFDLVRTDYAEDRHIGVRVTVPVQAPVTRPDQGG